jgi:hypothetical protein
MSPGGSSTGSTSSKGRGVTINHLSSSFHSVPSQTPSRERNLSETRSVGSAPHNSHSGSVSAVGSSRRPHANDAKSISMVMGTPRRPSDGMNSVPLPDEWTPTTVDPIPSPRSSKFGFEGVSGYEGFLGNQMPMQSMQSIANQMSSSPGSLHRSSTTQVSRNSDQSSTGEQPLTTANVRDIGVGPLALDGGGIGSEVLLDKIVAMGYENVVSVYAVVRSLLFALGTVMID